MSATNDNSKLDYHRLAAIVEASDDAIMGKDMNGVVTSWNKGAEKIFGYMAGEMIGTSITRLLPPDRLEEENQILEKIKRGESVRGFETLRRSKDGRLVDVAVTICPIHDAAGQIVGVSKVARDITVRKQHEQEVARLSRLCAVLSQINQAIVFLHDRDELFTKICRVLVEFGGFRMAWAGWLDANTRRVIPVGQWGDRTNYLSQITVYADDRPEGQGPTGTAIREGRNYICNDFNHDPRTRPWRQKAEQANFRASAAFLIRQHGTVCGAVTIYADETGFFQDQEIKLLEEAAGDISFALDNLAREAARLQAEEALRASEKEFHTLAESMPQIVWVTRPDGWNIYFNQQWVEYTGLTLEESHGHGWNKPFHPDDQQRAWDAWQAATTQLAKYSLECRLRRADGEYRWWLVRGVPLKDAAGNILKWFGTCTDIHDLKMAEEKAAQNQERFKLIFDSIPVGVALARQHPDGRFERDINDAHLRICGLTREQDQIPGIYLKITHPEDAARQAELGRPFDNGRDGQFTMEKRYLRPEGAVVWVVFTFRRQHYADGSIEELTTVVDITERKRAELALREKTEALTFANVRLSSSEQKLRGLYELSPLGIALTDMEGHYLEFNEAFRAICGYPAEELKQLDYWQLTPKSYDLDEARQLETLRQTGFYGPYEKHYRRRDGTLIPISLNGMLVTDATGHNTIWSIVEDITERKKVEQALKQEQAMLTDLLDSIPDHIYFKDRQSHFVRINGAMARHFGLRDPSEAFGKTDFDMFSEKHARTAFNDEQQIMETGVPKIAFEEKEIWPDGRVTWVSTTKMPLRGAEGRITGLVGISRNITANKALEEQLRQSQKMEAIGTLAGGVAHDFNNILAVLSMEVGLLKGRDGFAPEQAEYLDHINTTIERAATLTRQLLMFSRREVLQLRDLDLSETITHTTKMLGRILGENIEMQLNLGAEPMLVHADAGMLDQVLLNLAVNARDAMPNGGRLVITTAGVEFDEFAAAQSAQARPGAFVCLSVADTGGGIPPEVLPRIFEPFFTTKDIGKGTGLGLATVFGIVQQHQGWINVYSEVGQGTTLKVYLPRLAKTKEPMRGGEPKLVKIPGGTETILLVEDEPALRACVKMTLAKLGYRVLEAPTGLQALEVWREHRDPIHLLLTDMLMPDGMTGKELAQRLLKKNPKLKVIYMSGYSADLIGKDFPVQTNVNFLAKPFLALQLAQILRDNLDKPAKS